eukprot:4327705-Prymnesium_polylepis.1
MFALYTAAVAHDLAGVETHAPQELLSRIAKWRSEGVREKAVAWMVKMDVLNDSMMQHFPAVLQLEINGALLDEKPSLVALYAKLRDQYSEDTVHKAMQRASTLHNHQIAHITKDAHDLVLQLSNRDD